MSEACSVNSVRRPISRKIAVYPLSVRKTILGKVPSVSLVCAKSCLQRKCLRTLVIVMEGNARRGSSFASTKSGNRCASSAGIDR